MEGTKVGVFRKIHIGRLLYQRDAKITKIRSEERSRTAANEMSRSQEAADVLCGIGPRLVLKRIRN